MKPLKVEAPPVCELPRLLKKEEDKKSLTKKVVSVLSKLVGKNGQGA